MNALEFLRRVTRPMSMAEANQLGASRGAGRENASCDDTLSVQRARVLDLGSARPRSVSPSGR